MNIESILAPEHVFCRIPAASKKRAIEQIALKLAESIEGISAEDLFSKLINREKMGTTAIGDGIAIPHCRLDGINEITGALFTLEQPVDFQAFDSTQVSVLFVLLVPTDEVDQHLQVLAMLANRFESSEYREGLLGSNQSNLFERTIAT